ncbi:MAG: hypothetical protein A2268_10735 [Candidatus Raymondbacteria bacterium RifOxyA12_full_50_37]|uniref:Uncharacterized protein n=1 Tax=Candidatus Raymondbacteria bacterium RIFOXYD12_FULL_49_13 TaxID=1817890 RepID=A0A1F7F8S0_UNCRA|nr:MAG: hypothetical protein A2268_10735 [Candidatus Raymondbacteria bacterium RifOxyA12_full_50_37]OGJ85439.1 MAG: hypothetical protein A2248_12520 [Candidatus Raymondbacteria bacterium RIFOXYA2_FULL_49_16]OGK03064.1 MAG: hypothetical protein A2519_21480 [Candidatus Raymondbacteria bacterium RIFOXYD12_FULL_49_13]OGP45579.1 MAG: hypothetical protein A2324_04380 [Candidatus Raymondbacteria bacterium RIFOXYB2_FULL_49_35]
MVFSNKPDWYLIFVEPEQFLQLTLFLKNHGYERKKDIKYDGYSKNFYRFEKKTVHQDKSMLIRVNIFFSIPELLRIQNNEDYKKIADSNTFKIETIPPRQLQAKSILKRRIRYSLLKQRIAKTFWVLGLVGVCAVLGKAVCMALSNDAPINENLIIIEKLDHLERMVKDLSKSENKP